MSSASYSSASEEKAMEELKIAMLEKLFNIEVDADKTTGEKSTEPKLPDFAPQSGEKVTLTKNQKWFFDFIPRISKKDLGKNFPDFPMTVFQPKDWPESMRFHIPEIDKHYIPQKKEIYLLARAFETGDRVLMCGPTGSGKTSLVEFLCALTNRPFLRINGRGDMESAPIFGQQTVESGNLKWQDGIITEGAKNGAVILFDEPFVVPPEIQMGMNPILEEKPKLILTDKPGTMQEKTVIPHKLTRIVYCDNTGGLGDEKGAHAGVNVQNTSTLDRFQTIIILDYLSAAHELAIIKEKVPEITEQLANKMLSFAGLIRTNYIQGELSLTMSPRTLLSWASKAVFYQSAEQAIKVCFFAKFTDEGEQQAVSAHYRTVFGKGL